MARRRNSKDKKKRKKRLITATALTSLALVGGLTLRAKNKKRIVQPKSHKSNSELAITKEQRHHKTIENRQLFLNRTLNKEDKKEVLADLIDRGKSGKKGASSKIQKQLRFAAKRSKYKRRYNPYKSNKDK